MLLYWRSSYFIHSLVNRSHSCVYLPTVFLFQLPCNVQVVKYPSPSLSYSPLSPFPSLSISLSASPSLPFLLSPPLSPPPPSSLLQFLTLPFPLSLTLLLSPLSPSLPFPLSPSFAAPHSLVNLLWHWRRR